MRPFQFLNLACLAFAAAFPVSAWAVLPARDITIELRQIEDSEAAATSVSTQPERPLLAPQRVRVRNGEKASLRLNLSVPLLWVQRLEVQAQSGAAAGAVSGAGITQALTWMEAGQSLVVTPRWAGGRQAVVVEIAIESALVDASTGAVLPQQVRSQVASTVQVPPGAWVTVATQGQARQPGVYSSHASSDAPRMVQIRATLD